MSTSSQSPYIDCHIFTPSGPLSNVMFRSCNISVSEWDCFIWIFISQHVDIPGVPSFLNTNIMPIQLSISHNPTLCLTTHFSPILCVKVIHLPLLLAVFLSSTSHIVAIFFQLRYILQWIFNYLDMMKMLSRFFTRPLRMHSPHCVAFCKSLPWLVGLLVIRGKLVKTRCNA